MTWRDPRGREETVEASCDNLRELAAAYSPIQSLGNGFAMAPHVAVTVPPWAILPGLSLNVAASALLDENNESVSTANLNSFIRCSLLKLRTRLTGPVLPA